MGTVAAAIEFYVVPTIAAVHGIQIFIGQLVAFLFGQRQQLLRALARQDAFSNVIRHVCKNHSRPPLAWLRSINHDAKRVIVIYHPSRAGASWTHAGTMWHQVRSEGGYSPFLRSALGPRAQKQRIILGMKQARSSYNPTESERSCASARNTRQTYDYGHAKERKQPCASGHLQ